MSVWCRFSKLDQLLDHQDSWKVATIFSKWSQCRRNNGNWKIKPVLAKTEIHTYIVLSLIFIFIHFVVFLISFDFLIILFAQILHLWKATNWIIYFFSFWILCNALLCSLLFVLWIWICTFNKKETIFIWRYCQFHYSMIRSWNLAMGADATL